MEELKIDLKERVTCIFHKSNASNCRLGLLVLTAVLLINYIYLENLDY